MMTQDDYVQLITTEHRSQPHFQAAVRQLVAGFVDGGDVTQSFVSDFDIDSAVGVQLDAIGLWVGISRNLPVPITDVYFSWDSTASVGWDSGYWRGPFDPETEMSSLPDADYRQLIRAKIAANSWDGTLGSASAIWRVAFNGEQVIIIQDNQDMSMTVGFVGPPMTAVQQALLVGGYLPLKPAGVRVKFFAIPVNDGPLFSWDADSELLSGWDSGSWAMEV